VVKIPPYPLPTNIMLKIQNQMKKIFAVFFLLICGLVVLLATVDLEPYLTSGQSAPTKTIDLSAPAANGEPAGTTVTNRPAATASPEPTAPEKPFPAPEAEITQQENIPADNPPAVVAEESTTEQQQTSPPPSPENIPSTPIELEVTILPEGEYPFSILLETFVERATAELAIPYYQQRGISAHWVKVDLGDSGIRYRLFTGEFSSVQEAQLFLDQQKLVDKPIKPTYYAARVGVYQDKGQLVSAFVETRDLGVIPYVLGTTNGEYYLYVGAFYTFVGATAQCHELIEAGLSCEPVRRSTIRSE